MAYDIPLGSTSIPIVFGPLVSTSDHITSVTGLSSATMLVTICKSGSTAYAAPSGAIKEMGNGMYFIAASTLDNATAGPLAVHVTSTSGNDPFDQVVAQVVDPNASVYGANVVKFGGTAVTGRDIGASVLLSSGTGTGQLSLSAGVASVNVTQINSSAVNTSVAQIGANTVNLGGVAQTGRDIGASVLVSSGVGTGQLNISGGNINVTGDFSSTMKASIAASSVAAVSGSVGSVTGNVGGNVAGSVNSVTNRVTANSDQFAGQTITASSLGVVLPNLVAGTTNITAGTITNLTNAPTNGDLTAAMKVSVETAVWDAVLSSHLSSGTAGKALNSAGAAADPWATVLPGAYTAGSAGYIVGTNIDALISSRLAALGYTAPDNTSITAIKTQTDKLTFHGSYVKSDIREVNDVTVNGVGSTSSPWGP